jgi:hypothetical protein
VIHTPSSRLASRRIGRSVLVSLAAFAAYGTIGGCNAILDNKPGHLDDNTTAIAPAQPASSQGGTTDDGPDAPVGNTPPSEVPSPVPPPPTVQCAPNQQMCHGVCVDISDPLYGCGDPSCSPCRVAHGTAMCVARTCAVKACDTGFADCNKTAADGCEADLSLGATCGRCDTACRTPTPMCAPLGTTFGCTSGCSAAAPLLCGTDCVSPLTSTNHCGGCATPCADVAQATVSCLAGKCAFTCKASYHACAGKCVVDTDPTACGAACTACPVPPNASATCQANACGLQCKAGYGNCNGQAGDGCEASLTSDPDNCGACGNRCDGGTCENSRCLAKPPPPSDAGG